MRLNKRVQQKVITIAGLYFLRLLLTTMKIEKRRKDGGYYQLIKDKKAIYAFWHSAMVPSGYAFKFLGLRVLVSQHRDGEYIAGALNRLGFDTIRGSSTRGGTRALIRLVKLASIKRSYMLTPDGPRGPRHVVQPGIVFLAKKTGIPIIPVSAKISKYWELPSWDKFEIPKPFSKATLVFGDPIHVAPDSNREQIAQYCKRLEDVLNFKN